MKVQPDEEPPPCSTDLEGWRRSVQSGCHANYPMETVIAALQDLGPNADTEVINALALHASATILRILRRLIGRNHPNEGADIIDEVHGQLIEAILSPNTPDGKGLREAFVPRLKFRAADALRAARARRDREQLVEDVTATCEAKHADDIGQKIEMEGRLYVEEVLSHITDERKRLAFRLHMDGIPLKSKRTTSIEQVLGVSSKTAGQWIEEIQAQLKNIVEGQS
jgi:hypothetical protein